MPTLYLAGLDEAGRGPLLGPLYLALVRFFSPSQLELPFLKDSKAFGSSARAMDRRREAAQIIKAQTQWQLIALSAPVVDRYVRDNNGLNRLEREAAQLLLRRLPQGTLVIADGATLFSPLCSSFPTLVAQDSADATHRAVSAASIVAKSARDDWYRDFCHRMEIAYGLTPKGGGYANAHTYSFLHAFREKTGRLPGELRTSWSIPKKQLSLFSAFTGETTR